MAGTVEQTIPGFPAGARTRACAGGGDIARAIRAFTWPSGTGFFPGGRVASRSNPSTPAARKRSHRRLRHPGPLQGLHQPAAGAECQDDTGPPDVLPDAPRDGGGRIRLWSGKEGNPLFLTDH